MSVTTTVVKAAVLLLLLASKSADAATLYLDRTDYIAMHELGDIELMHDEEGFHVIKDDIIHDVRSYNVDKSIRKLSTQELYNFLGKQFDTPVELDAHDLSELALVPMTEREQELFFNQINETGYIVVTRMSDGEYALKAHMRVRGGGPIFGAIAYWATKTLCYGAAVATVSAAGATVVVATGGGAVGAAAGVGVFAGEAAIGTALGVGTPILVTSAAISGAGLTGAATMGTATVVAGAGSVAGAIAAVEGASTSAGLFFTMLPFLP